MKLIISTIGLLLSFSLLQAAEEQDYQQILEAKYSTSIQELKVIDYSDNTKVLGFDFEASGDKSWWGSFNLVEVDQKGAPLYWYDIPQTPTEAVIKRIQVVELSGMKYLEVIACSHEGNGSLYLYELRKGCLHLLVNCRVMTNLSWMHFSPNVASIAYRDLDEDGDHDLIIKATCLKGLIIDKSKQVVGKYRRIYHQEDGEFTERVRQRDGAPFLMD